MNRRMALSRKPSVAQMHGREAQLSKGQAEMTPEQCRMARAGLSIGARELAEAARVSVSTVTRFEAGQVVHEMTLALIQTALERYGIEFVADSSGVGAWLRKPSKSIIPAANLNAENKPA